MRGCLIRQFCLIVACFLFETLALECILSKTLNGRSITNKTYDQLMICPDWCAVAFSKTAEGLEVSQGCGNRCDTYGTMQIVESRSQISQRCCNTNRCNVFTYTASSNLSTFSLTLIFIMTKFF